MRPNLKGGFGLVLTLLLLTTLGASLGAYFPLLAFQEQAIRLQLNQLQAEKSALFGLGLALLELHVLAGKDGALTHNADLFEQTSPSRTAWLGLWQGGNASKNFKGWLVSGEKTKFLSSAFLKESPDAISIAEWKEGACTKNICVERKSLGTTFGRQHFFAYWGTDLGVHSLKQPSSFEGPLFETTRFLACDVPSGGLKKDLGNCRDLEKLQTPLSLKELTLVRNFFHMAYGEALEAQPFIFEKASDSHVPVRHGIYPVLLQAFHGIHFTLTTTGEIRPHTTLAWVLWNPYSMPIKEHAYCVECRLSMLNGESPTASLTPENFTGTYGDFSLGSRGTLSRGYIKTAFLPGEIKLFSFDNPTQVVDFNEGNSLIEGSRLSSLPWSFVIRGVNDLYPDLTSEGTSLFSIQGPAFLQLILSDAVSKNVFQSIDFGAMNLGNKPIRLNDSNAVVGFLYGFDLDRIKEAKTDSIDWTKVQIRACQIKGSNEVTWNSFQPSSFLPWQLEEEMPQATEDSQSDKKNPWKLMYVEHPPEVNSACGQFAEFLSLKAKPLYFMGKDASLLETLSALSWDPTNQRLPAFCMGEGSYLMDSRANKTVNECNHKFWDSYFFSEDGKLKSIFKKTPFTFKLIPDEPVCEKLSAQLHAGINVHSVSIEAWTEVLKAAFLSKKYLIDEKKVQRLAQLLIREIRQRGPFKALAEFVRDTKFHDESFIPGCLQSALTRATKMFELPPLTQAEILASIGSHLHVRSDSFLLRGYGESRGENNCSQCICEAVVQRVPFDGEEEKSLFLQGERNASERNAEHRSFQVVSFRWLKKLK